MKKFRMIAAVIVLLIGVVGAASVQASVVTIADGNSSAQIDTGSQAGMYNWTIDGNNVLFQQWFWYRVGPTGLQQAISDIGPAAVSQLDPTGVKLTYTASDFAITVNYGMLGGALKSGTADISESIRITNLSRSNLEFHFFQYSDFDLNPRGQNSAVLTSPTLITQKNPYITVSETSAIPAPNHYQISYYDDLLQKLVNVSGYTLSDTNDTTVGDITWAFEWDLILSPGGSFIISKDKHVSGVPEPGILVLLGSGLIGALVVRKKFGKN
jgi:hypothetical protein